MKTPFVYILNYFILKHIFYLISYTKISSSLITIQLHKKPPFALQSTQIYHIPFPISYIMISIKLHGKPPLHCKLRT